MLRMLEVRPLPKKSSQVVRSSGNSSNAPWGSHRNGSPIPKWLLALRYIGCSKLACFACWRFVSCPEKLGQVWSFEEPNRASTSDSMHYKVEVTGIFAGGNENTSCLNLYRRVKLSRHPCRLSRASHIQQFLMPKKCNRATNHWLIIV